MYYYYKSGQCFGLGYLPSGSTIHFDVDHLEGPFSSIPDLLKSLPASYDGGGKAVRILYVPEVY